MSEKSFQKGKIGTLEIKNRFVMAPMGSHHADADHMVTQSMIDYYVARAKGGFGLLIVEYTCVDPEGLADSEQLGVYSDDMIPGLNKLATAVQEVGAKIFLQLQHCGRETSPNETGKQTVAPSPVPSPLYCNMPRALSVEEIQNIVERFSDAAVRAKKAGFDGVEVQMGHGYLLGQFLSPSSNKRIDEYGGSLNGRMKICLDVVKSIREKCGREFPLSCRISGDECVESGITIFDSEIIAQALEKVGADAIHVSIGSLANMDYMVAPTCVPAGFNNANIARIKNAVNIPVIGVGKINDSIMAETMLAEGVADFVSLGRAAIADPEFPNKAASGNLDEITPCVGCLTRCWGEPGIKNDRWRSCMMNPFAGYEGTMKIEKADKVEKIVVIGAGPAGMEYAWIAAARGHQVVLLEKEARVGGQLRIASIAPGKIDFGRGVKWLWTMCRKHGVDIRLETEADKEFVLSLKPDKIVVATGAKAVVPFLNVKDIPCVTAFDVLEGKYMLGSKVLVLGGGMVGLETAEFAAVQGRVVTVVERLSNVGNGIGGAQLSFMMKSLKEKNVQLLTETTLLSADADGVLCEQNGVRQTLTGYDMIVMAVGTRSENSLKTVMEETGIPVITFGDAVKPGRAYTAIEEAAVYAVEA